MIHRPMASAERFGIFDGALKKRSSLARGCQRLQTASQGRGDGRREGAAGAVGVRRRHSPAGQDLE
jgi:hypothetical protein